MNNTSQTNVIHTGLPSWFKATCWEAALGGRNGYWSAGWSLAGHLGHEIPDDCDWDTWSEMVAELQELAAQEDEDGVWRWFAGHYPRMMRMIPARRRAQFVAGVLANYQETALKL